MPSFLIKIDSYAYNASESDDISVNFPQPIQLTSDDDMKTQFGIALLKAQVWYSWANISATIGNNVIRYSHNSGTNWNSITIPDGTYSITQLETYIHSVMKDNSHYNSGDNTYYVNFVPNYATFKLRIELSNNYQLDLTQSTIYTLLGHANTTLTSTTTGAGNVDITAGVNSIDIRCNLVKNSYNNGSFSDTIQSFSPNVPAGSLINISESNPVFLPLNQKNISTLRVRLTSQDGTPIDLRGEQTSYLFQIKEI